MSFSRAVGSSNPVDIVTDAVVALLNERGVAGLSLRALARHLGMNPGIVNQWFGSRAGMLEQVTYRLGGRWLRWLDARWGEEGLLGLLPLLADDADALRGLRAWLSLIELARSEPAVAGAMQKVQELERSRLVDAGIAIGEVPALVAFAHGLHRALFGPEAMELEEARDLLRTYAERSGLETSPSRM